MKRFIINENEKNIEKITKEFKLICSVIDSKKKKNNETIIELQENNSEEYSLCFTL